jgi:hypothetical protein
VAILERRSACDINEGPGSDEGATDGVGGDPLMAVAASYVGGGEGMVVWADQS